MTNQYSKRDENSPAEPDAPTEDTATSYPEGERLDLETGEPVDPQTGERPANAPEHNQDGSRYDA